MMCCGSSLMAKRRLWIVGYSFFDHMAYGAVVFKVVLNVDCQ